MTVDLDAARKMLLELVDPCAAERISLENSWGRLLAEDIRANEDHPPFDRSLMDGYAVISGGVADASPQKPVVLREIDNIPAGSVGRHPIGPGQAARIMTGAPLPPGADGVVRLEDTVRAGTGIHILAGAEVQKNISRRGEEFRRGEVVLRRGMSVGAGAMSILAMLGEHAPLVFRRPRVGILVTGSEIIDVSAQLAPGKIRNSNSYMLLAQIKEAGGEPVLLGKVSDATDTIAEALEKAPQCELVITTGGVSTGDFDLMDDVFAKLGVPLLFERMDVKPGMPVLAGRWQEKMLLALTGNPAGASVAFEVLVRPLIRKLAGAVCLWRVAVKAVLQDGFCKGTLNRRFIWAQCHWRKNEWIVRPLTGRHDSVFKSINSANALIDIPPNSPPLPAGEKVTVMLLDRQPILPQNI